MSQSVCLRERERGRDGGRIGVWLGNSTMWLKTHIKPILLPQSASHPPTGTAPQFHAALDQSGRSFTAIVTMAPAEGAHHVSMETASVYNVWRRTGGALCRHRVSQTLDYLRMSAVFFVVFFFYCFFNEAEVTMSTAGGVFTLTIISVFNGAINQGAAERNDHSDGCFLFGVFGSISSEDCTGHRVLTYSINSTEHLFSCICDKLEGKGYDWINKELICSSRYQNTHPADWCSLECTIKKKRFSIINQKGDFCFPNSGYY